GLHGHDAGARVRDVRSGRQPGYPLAQLVLDAPATEDDRWNARLHYCVDAAGDDPPHRRLKISKSALVIFRRCFFESQRREHELDARWRHEIELEGVVIRAHSRLEEADSRPPAVSRSLRVSKRHRLPPLPSL